MSTDGVLNSCFLCQQTAKIRRSQHGVAFLVDCPACGGYQIDNMIAGSQEFKDLVDEHYRLSALTRHASDRGERLKIGHPEELLEAIAGPKPLDKLNRALEYMGDHQTRLDAPTNVSISRDFPLIVARDGAEFSHLLKMLEGMGYLHGEDWAFGNPNAYLVTPEGWSQLDRIGRERPDSDKAFVAMWLEESLRSAWEDGFKPALEAAGYVPTRVDLVEHNQKIDDLIIAEIRRSGLLVADFTGHRGGVYFEAGFAMGLGIPVIWTCKATDIEQAHFDTRQYNHIVWAEPEELRTKLGVRIQATIPRLG